LILKRRRPPKGSHQASLTGLAQADPLPAYSQCGDTALVAATINAPSSACAKADRIVYREFRDEDPSC
jgi:hypothetical protein